MPPIERRFTAGPGVRVETREGGGVVVTGYAAVFYDAEDRGTEYQLYRDIVERIKPGAFDRAIKEDDVRALFNHDHSLVLGRNKAGTLRLSVDAKGLRYEIDAPDTATGRDVAELIRRGDVTGSSFCFVPDVTTYREEGDTYIVERESVRLFDVSPVTFPAYEATTTGLRSDGDAEAIRAEVAKLRPAKRTPRDVVAASARWAEING